MCLFTLAESVGTRLSISFTEDFPVDWTSAYKPERRADIADIAQAIHDSVTIEQALEFYFPLTPRRHHRCPCPLHCGTDYNFSYTEHGYKCFVCGASGDVVALVKEACELSTRADAMKKISSDFNLGLFSDAPLTPEISAKIRRAREDADRKRAERKAWGNAYHAALDEWIDLDCIIIHTPQDSEENIVKVCRAREKRAEVGYRLDTIMAKQPV